MSLIYFWTLSRASKTVKAVHMSQKTDTFCKKHWSNRPVDGNSAGPQDSLLVMDQQTSGNFCPVLDHHLSCSAKRQLKTDMHTCSWGCMQERTHTHIHARTHIHTHTESPFYPFLFHVCFVLPWCQKLGQPEMHTEQLCRRLPGCSHCCWLLPVPVAFPVPLAAWHQTSPRHLVSGTIRNTLTEKLIDSSYFTSSQPWRSYKDEKQVIISQVMVSFAVHVT